MSFRPRGVYTRDEIHEKLALFFSPLYLQEPPFEEPLRENGLSRFK